MPITRNFRRTIWARAQSDARFRAAMLSEAVGELLRGETAAGRAMLRDYVNAAMTFERLARETGIPAKSLQRMLGPRGNPTAENLFTVIRTLQRHERIRLTVGLKRAA